MNTSPISLSSGNVKQSSNQARAAIVQVRVGVILIGTSSAAVPGPVRRTPVQHDDPIDRRLLHSALLKVLRGCTVATIPITTQDFVAS